MDLSILIPVLRATDNLNQLVAQLQPVLADLNVAYEILVLKPPCAKHARAASYPASPSSITHPTTYHAPTPGYGALLMTGFQAARGAYILTLDPDFSGPLEFIETMWARRSDAEVVVASRYVAGGRAHMPPLRALASRLLNGLFRRGLSLPVRDFSSGFRLYRASVVQGQSFQAQGFEIVQEILVRIYAQGWHVLEIPFDYQTSDPGDTQALRFGVDYVRTFGALWSLRNSILTADYDHRAYDSPIPLQRYWQRSRYQHITELMAGEGPVLDVGCGSSRIIGALPLGSVALDILLRKLRFARQFGKPLVQGSGFHLPFPDHSFPCVVCSQVIEHVPMESPILDELIRVLAPGGRLVLGTPDYANWEWVVTEKLYAMAAPGGYADEHIAHYTRQGLIDHFTARGFTHEATRYILRGELILALRKEKGNRE